jgi:hypothetical protein
MAPTGPVARCYQAPDRTPLVNVVVITTFEAEEEADCAN